MAKKQDSTEGVYRPPNSPERQGPSADQGEAYEETVVESEAVSVVHVPAGAHAVATLSDVGALMEEDATQVNHGFKKEDIAVPFLRVLQSNSPQVKRTNPAYLDGAEEGFFFNTATSQLWSGAEGIDVIPVAFQQQATLWWPRESGGPKGEKGFVREVSMAEYEALLKTTQKNDKGKDVTRDNQELVRAALYYMMIITERSTTPTFELVAYPLTFTQLKKSRAWNALILGARLPNSSGLGTYNPKMYGFSYHLTTVPEQNAKGSWMGLKVVRTDPLLKYVDGKPAEGFPGAAQFYLAARELETLVASGRAKVKTEELMGTEESDYAVGGMAGPVSDDQKTPF